MESKINNDFEHKEYFVIGYLLNFKVYKEYFSLMKLEYIKYMNNDYNDKNIN